jgi:cyclase
MKKRNKFYARAVRLLQTGTGKFIIYFRSALIGSAISLSFASLAAAQNTDIQTTRLSPRALFVKGPDSNVLVVDSSEGLVLVDGGGEAWSEALRTAIAEQFPGRPYRALFNTHWHREVTGSNLVLGQQGVEIIAHENTMLWESTEVWQRWSGITFAPLPESALPGTLIQDDGSMTIGDTTVHYGYMRSAHTDGDIWVYFEEDDLLVTGPLVSNGRWPEIDWWTGGYIGGMLDGFVSLMSVPTANTTIVPGYGDLMNLEQLQAQNQMYLTIFDRFHGSLIKSWGLKDILAEQHTAEFEAAMGDPTEFMTLAYQSFQGRVRDPQNYRVLNIP